MYLRHTKNEKDKQFVGKLHPWDAGRVLKISVTGKRPLKSKKNPQLF